MPTPDIITGMNDVPQLAADQESQANDVTRNNPTQFAVPDMGAPKGLYGTVDPAENINIDRTTQLYNQIGTDIDAKHPRSSSDLPTINLPQSETNRFTGNKYGFNIAANNESAYAKDQGLPSMLANSLFNGVVKTGAYLLQNAGFIIGAPATALPGGISNMTDNFLTRAGDAMKDWVSEAAPIYKSDKYQNSSIWGKLGTAGWWLDDGMDRLALTAGLIFPGIAESKGLSLFGAAADAEVTGAVRGTGLLTKGLEEYASNPENYGELGKKFLNKLYNAAATGTEPANNAALQTYLKGLNRAELYGWNVIGQSGLNAKEAQDSITKSLKEQRADGVNSMSDDEIKNKAAEGALKAFGLTVPLSFIGDLYEIPQMFSTVKGAKSMLDKVFNPETAEAIAAESLGKQFSKVAFKAAATGFEHGQNESMQVAVGRYVEDSIAGKKNPDGTWKKDPRGTLNGVWADYLDNINDPNGQNNIALGTIQGMFMTLGGRAKAKITGEDRVEGAEKAYVSDIINKANFERGLYNGQDFIKKDADGKPVIQPDGSVKFDDVKLADAVFSLMGTQESIDLKKQAIERGDYATSNLLNFQSLYKYAYPFFSDPNGMEHVANRLTIEAKGLKPGFGQNDFENGVEVSPQVQLQRNLEHLKDLKRTYDAIDDQPLTLKDIDADSKDREDRKAGFDFLQRVKYAQYRTAANQSFIEKRIEANENEISSIVIKRDTPYEGGLIKDPSNPLEQRHNNLVSENEMLIDTLEGVKQQYKALIEKKGLKQAFVDFKAKRKGDEERVKEQEQKAAQPEPPTPPEPTAPVQGLPAPAQVTQKAAETGTTQADQAPVDQKKAELKDVLDKKNQALQNTTDKKEQTAINKKYLDDVREIYAKYAPKTVEKSPEEQAKRAAELKAMIPEGKTIPYEQQDAVSNLISDAKKQGDISEEHEASLIKSLLAKQVVGTFLDGPQDYEDDQKEPEPTEVGPSDVDKDSSKEPETDKVDSGYNPLTTTIEEPEDSDIFSAIAFMTSNKTVTQEQQDVNGRPVGALDEDPYKQFKQNFLRKLNSNPGRIHNYNAMIVKDNPSFPHSIETTKALAAGVPYGAVLMITDKDFNRINFGPNYEESLDQPQTVTPEQRADIERRRKEELNKLETQKNKDLEEANKLSDAPPIIKILRKGVVDTNSLRKNGIDTANSSYEYGVKRANAKYDAELNQGPKYQPLIYSFNKVAWDRNKDMRAAVGELRTGVSMDDFLAMYEQEAQEQELARKLTDQGKNVKVQVKFVSPGMINKAHNLIDAREAITPEMGATLYIPPTPLDKYDPENPKKNKFVLVGSQALINGGLYARMADPVGGRIYVRLLPKKILETPLYENVKSLLEHTYKDENEGEIAKAYLTDLLFLNRAKRPGLKFDTKTNELYMVVDKNRFSPEQALDFAANTNFNILRENLNNPDRYNDFTIKEGKLAFEEKEDYHKFVIDHSQTRDLPIKTKDGLKYLNLNSYMGFTFMDSLDSMKNELAKGDKIAAPGERDLVFKNDEIPVLRHGEAEDDAQGKTSGKNPTPLTQEGIEMAEKLGSLLKNLGVKALIHSGILRAEQTAKIAAKIAGITQISKSYRLKTWDIGDFAGGPRENFDEQWFINNPNETEHDGKKVGESFNDYVKRMIKAYKYFSVNALPNTAVITHSRNIRVWDAYKLNNEQWNSSALDKYMNLPSEHSFTSVVRSEKDVNDNSTLTRDGLRKLKAKKPNNAQDLADQERKKGLFARRVVNDLGQLEQTEIDKVNQTFGSEVARRVYQIANSNAVAQWTEAGIKLTRDAKQGDAYHEAWHHFSQLYLNDKEKRGLYDEMRKKNINFTSRDGRDLNTKTASDFDIEEFTADDFRDYARSGGTSRAVNRPYRNNIFRKILDFLKKFFFGDINVAKLYNDLYTGRLYDYKSSVNNAWWGKLDARALNNKKQEIFDNAKAAYFRDVVDYKMGQQLLGLRTSVDAMRRNGDLTQAIYENIYNDILKNHLHPLLRQADADPKGNTVDQNLVEDLYSLLSNWEDFVQFHKDASKLYLNIPHSVIQEVPSVPDDYTEDDELGGENYDIKDQTDSARDDRPEDEESIVPQWDRAGNELSSWEAASPETRALIRMLPMIEFKGGTFNKVVDQNGFEKLNDYNKTWNNIADILSNLSSPEEMIEEMKDPKSQAKVPEFTELLKYLPDPAKDHSYDEINQLTRFYTDFNKSYIGIFSGIMYPDGGFFFTEETKRNLDQIKKNWANNFVNRRDDDINVANGNVLMDTELGRYYLNNTKNLAYNMKSPAERDAFLDLLGVKFSDGARATPFFQDQLSQRLRDIQANINARHALGQKMFSPISDLRQDLRDDNREIAVAGLRNIIDGALVYLESEFSNETPSMSYRTAEGHMIHGLSLNHTISNVVNRLNRANSYQDIIDNPSSQFLNLNNNDDVKDSLFLNALFNLNPQSTNYGKKTKNQIMVGNYNGFKFPDKDGNTVGYSTTGLNTRQKVIFDMNSLLTQGAVEIMRTEVSKSAYFVKLKSYDIQSSDKSRSYLPVGISEFSTSFNSPKFISILKGYLRGELYRIQNAKNTEVYKTDYTTDKRLQKYMDNFNRFIDILRVNEKGKDPEILKNSLKAFIEKGKVEDAIEKFTPQIEDAIQNYFKGQLDSFKNRLKEENITGADLSKNLEAFNHDQRIRAFLANDFILNVEYTKLFDGDTVYQAHYKDYFKRSKGAISTGKVPNTGDSFVRYMQSIEHNTFAGFVGSKRKNDYKTVNTINIQDDVRESKYLDIYRKNLKEVDPNLSDEEVEKILDKYKKMTIGDGQGHISLDFYRQFLKSIDNWSDAQEKMYQVELARYRLANAQFNPQYTNENKGWDRDFLKKNGDITFSYFPPIKMQYHGPIKATGTYAQVMDKFSVAPLIPSVIKGTPLEELHNEMIKNGIGYSKFVSGTKKYVHPPIEMYNKEGYKGVDLSEKEPAQHFLEFLKEQINTNPDVKLESIFGTQVRTLIEANIFSNGEARPIDVERHERYKSILKSMQNLNKKELFDELSLVEEKGNYVVKDVKKFVSTLKAQADNRDLNNNILDYLQYDESKDDLMYPLEGSLNRAAVQDFIMGLIDRKLRKQQISGDMIPQVSSSGFESNDFKYTNATEEEVKKYGTNGLRFYHLEGGKTVAAQVKVGLNAGFEKLLLKTHPDGQKIGSIERLNELLKDKDWMDKNREHVTIIGYRIPTQGPNSIEFMEVAEFLPSHFAGLIPPAEIVAKAGSDFDIDKMNIFRPSLDDNGNLIKGASKEGYANQIISLYKEILEDPKYFKSLITPNDTNLVRPFVNEVSVALGKRSKKDADESKPYIGTQIYRYITSLRKFESLLSASKLLGVFAVNNKFSQLLQQEGVTTNTIYGVTKGPTRQIKTFLLSPKEREQINAVVKTEKGVALPRLNLANKFDVEGNLKQDYLSQFINATVDAPTDDFLGYGNLSYENIGVFCYLINQGVPAPRAYWFLHQPVLMHYYSELRSKASTDFKSHLQARVLSQFTGHDYFDVTEDGRVYINKKLFHGDINKILTEKRNQSVFFSIDNLKKLTRKQSEVEEFVNTDRNKPYNALVFAYFLSLKEQASLSREFQATSNFDTRKTQSPITSYQNLKQYYESTSQIASNKLFSISDLDKIGQNSIISPYNNRLAINKIGMTLMPVAYNPFFIAFATNIIANKTAFKPDAFKKKFTQNYETQWVEYVVKSLGTIDGKSLQSYTTQLTEGPKSLARRWNSFIDKYPQLKDDFSFVNKIRTNFSQRTGVKKANLEIPRIFENTTDDQNRYADEFRKLLDFHDDNYTAKQQLEVRKFFKDLAILGFVQSGFNRSQISFFDIVPYEVFADMFKNTMQNFESLIAQDRPLLKQYISEYNNQFSKNENKSIQSWRGHDYYLGGTLAPKVEARRQAVKVDKSQVNTEAEVKQAEPKALPAPKVEKTRSQATLNSMDAKSLYKEINKLESPTDAAGLALEYIAGGGQISPESLYNEVLAARDVRLAPTKDRTNEEVKSRDYVKKGAPTIKEAANSIWDNLDQFQKEKISDQDIRNELINVIKNFNKRFDIAKEYSERSTEAVDRNYTDNDMNGDYDEQPPWMSDEEWQEKLNQCKS